MTDVTAFALADALRDRYRLERELGKGGMATVYLARDLKHDRDVALKVLRPLQGLCGLELGRGRSMRRGSGTRSRCGVPTRAGGRLAGLLPAPQRIPRAFKDAS